MNEKEYKEGMKGFTWVMIEEEADALLDDNLLKKRREDVMIFSVFSKVSIFP